MSKEEVSDEVEGSIDSSDNQLVPPLLNLYSWIEA
ncbi:hypothetical protein CCACVL1_29502, partial [Corchorus capsularis]